MKLLFLHGSLVKHQVYTCASSDSEVTGCHWYRTVYNYFVGHLVLLSHSPLGGDPLRMHTETHAVYPSVYLNIALCEIHANVHHFQHNQKGSSRYIFNHLLYIPVDIINAMKNANKLNWSYTGCKSPGVLWPSSPTASGLGGSGGEGNRKEGRQSLKTKL